MPTSPSNSSLPDFRNKTADRLPVTILKWPTAEEPGQPSDGPLQVHCCHKRTCRKAAIDQRSRDDGQCRQWPSRRLPRRQLVRLQRVDSGLTSQADIAQTLLGEGLLLSRSGAEATGIQISLSTVFGTKEPVGLWAPIAKIGLVETSFCQFCRRIVEFLLRNEARNGPTRSVCSR
jgi:hypothetical protein